MTLVGHLGTLEMFVIKLLKLLDTAAESETPTGYDWLLTNNLPYVNKKLHFVLAFITHKREVLVVTLFMASLDMTSQERLSDYPCTWSDGFNHSKRAIQSTMDFLSDTKQRSLIISRVKSAVGHASLYTVEIK